MPQLWIEVLSSWIGAMLELRFQVLIRASVRPSDIGIVVSF